MAVSREVAETEVWGDGHISGELLDDLYLAAVHPEIWSSVLQRTAKEFGAEAGLLVVEDLTAPTPRWWASTPKHEKAFRERYFSRHRVNPWLLAARDRPIPSVARTESLVPLEQLRETGFYRDCLEPWDLLHSLGANLFATESSFAYLTLLRSPQQGPFDDSTLVRAGWLTAHLTRAIRLQHEIACTRSNADALLSLLAALPQPILLLGERLTIAYANPTAEKLLAEADGLLLVGDQVHARNSEDHASLLQSLGRLDQTSARTCVVRRKGSNRPLICRVDTMPTQQAQVHGKSVRFTIVIHDTAKKPVLVNESVQLAFGMTPAELNVASLLIGGLTPTRIAQELGVSVTTVRTHMSNLFSKTGTSRQAELVSQLLAFAAPGLESS